MGNNKLCNRSQLKKMYDKIYKEGSENFFSFSNFNESKLILDFVDSLKLDWFDYSIKMDDDSLLKEFEKKEGE